MPQNRVPRPHPEPYCWSQDRGDLRALVTAKHRSIEFRQSFCEARGKVLFGILQGREELRIVGNRQGIKFQRNDRQSRRLRRYGRGRHRGSRAGKRVMSIRDAWTNLRSRLFDFIERQR